MIFRIDWQIQALIWNSDINSSIYQNFDVIKQRNEFKIFMLIGLISPVLFHSKFNYVEYFLLLLLIR